MCKKISLKSLIHFINENNGKSLFILYKLKQKHTILHQNNETTMHNTPTLLKQLNNNAQYTHFV